MRKLSWWAAVLVAAGAGAAGLAAHYANRHPASWLGRLVAASPCCVSGAGLRAAAVVHHAAPHPAVAGKETARPMAEDCPELPACPPVPEAGEPIQVNMPEAADGQGGGQPESLGVVTGILAGCGDLGDGRCAGAAEECETDEQYIPPCPAGEAEDAGHLIPACPEDKEEKDGTIPYVEEDPRPVENSSGPLQVWFLWLKKAAQGSGKGAVRKGDGGEELELTPLCPRTIPQIPDVGEPAGGPLDPPNCQEDPHYDHQYPGCPYMGGCPKGGHCPPATPGPEAAPVKKHKKEVRAIPASLLHKVLKADYLKNDAFKGHCGLDTMECRPSDVKAVGVDPNAPF